MANMCDNSLRFVCKEIPSWFKKDPEAPHGITIEWESRFLFLYHDFDTILSDNALHTIDEEWNHHINIWFETKWSPPEQLYEQMMEDDNIISFDACWYESGCSVLWSATKDWITEDDAPNRCYSDLLDKYVLQDYPPQSYIEMEWLENETWILFSNYYDVINELKSDQDFNYTEEEISNDYQEVIDLLSNE